MVLGSIGLFANGVIFIAIASVFDPRQLLEHAGLIVAVFLLTTVVRFLVLVPLLAVRHHPLRLGVALRLGGMKGGLAIIMVCALPDSFEYKPMFLSVVVGVVILSIFLNSLLLRETLHECHAAVREALAADPFSGAYNPPGGLTPGSLPASGDAGP